MCQNEFFSSRRLLRGRFLSKRYNFALQDWQRMTLSKQGTFTKAKLMGISWRHQMSLKMTARGSLSWLEVFLKLSLSKLWVTQAFNVGNTQKWYAEIEIWCTLIGVTSREREHHVPNFHLFIIQMTRNFYRIF